MLLRYGAYAERLEDWVIKNSNWLALVIITAAFAIRLVYSESCYLNPDEAEHFGAARSSGWLETYKASLTLAHPALFILVLHATLFLGQSEPILRLPSLIAGTAALWLAFEWIRRSLGEISALAGLGFMAVCPAAISASTEVRQYGLLLFFVCGSLYATERTFSERSIKWAIAQGCFLLGALLTHYTAIVVILALDLYALLRLVQGGIPRRVLFTTGVFQLVLASVLAGLYLGHIRRAIVFRTAGSLDYLQHYYYVRTQETPLGFAWRALSGTFHYAVGIRPLAFLFMVVFVAGLIGLWASRTRATRVMALLTISPFVVGFAAAVARIFPFAGSRHQTYLLPFFAAGISAAFIWLRRGQAVPLLLLGAAIAPLWLAHSAPENDPRAAPIGAMSAAIDYVSRRVPLGAPLFVDDMTRDELRYYLGRKQSDLTVLRSKAGVEEWLGGYHIVVPRMPSEATFRPAEVVEQVTESARALGVPPDDPLWIVSSAWKEPSLASRLSAGTDHDAKEFGRISIIEVFSQKR
jgi:hypothetical protein